MYYLFNMNNLMVIDDIIKIKITFLYIYICIQYIGNYNYSAIIQEKSVIIQIIKDKLYRYTSNTLVIYLLK